MKAMVLRAVGEPLSLEERPDLKPTAGQIRVCVEACGVCRTDLHVVDGELPNLKLRQCSAHRRTQAAACVILLEDLGRFL